MAPVLTDEKLSVILKMRQRLHHLGCKINGSNWTSEQAAEILDIVAEGLSSLIDNELDNAFDDPRIIETHATTEVLAELADALRDIRHGNVDRRFRAPEGLGGAAHKTSEKKAVKKYLEYVDWVKVCDQSSYPVAEKKVAALLTELGIKFRGEAVTAKKLDGWRRTASGIQRTSK